MENRIQDVIEYVKNRALSFGAKEGPDFIFRENVIALSLEEGGAYFGFISQNEDVKGPYHDLCLVIFPDPSDGPWVISLGVGSLGYKEDYELASLPGLRRSFSRITKSEGFIKPSFLDLDTSLPHAFTNKIPNIKKSLLMYSKVLLACDILDDPLSDPSLKIIDGYLACYANIRQWPSAKAHREAITKALIAARVETTPEGVSEETEVFSLLLERRYVILTGAPGTGKTRMAKAMIKELNALPVFTQFHAETSYADFVYGIRPTLDKDAISYEIKLGVFSQAIKLAISNPEKPVLLIADEINRANLASVLGPVFYLFEYQLEPNVGSDKNPKLEIYPGLDLSSLPSNFYFIGTMNTADRSLAIVDFALRRRFAWYQLHPKAVHVEGFHKEQFEAMALIFDMYADSSELSLQPGQGYFFSPSADRMKQRIQYELFPLIKEYLNEGFLLKAQGELDEYFMHFINRHLWE